jgi:hypothetical protein
MKRKTFILLFCVMALCSCTTSKRYFTEKSDLYAASPDDLKRRLGEPAEIEISAPSKGIGAYPSWRWVYYFEAPDGSIREIGYYFVEGRWKTNEVLFYSGLSVTRYRLLSPYSKSDMEKIYLFRHSSRSNE